jgi:uncharacterized protein (DUF885 family)
MWRAVRLVVDSGVHEKHWSRDQMVAYFHRYTRGEKMGTSGDGSRG